MFKNSFCPNISIFRRVLIATFLKREHGPSCIFSEMLLEILIDAFSIHSTGFRNSACREKTDRTHLNRQESCPSNHNVVHGIV